MTTPVLVSLIGAGAVLAIVVIVAVSRRGGAAPRICGGCRRVMRPEWPRCMFCGWQPLARLEFIHGPMAGTRLELVDDVTTLGSVAGNTVVLADPAVSRKHAGIRREAGFHELADLGSTNGVYVNGQKVPKARLADGDVVRIGNTEAVFRTQPTGGPG